ncbi:GNAT family N-acetyltransferase [Brevundimonas sp. FT23028]|uniref:GNAT family N-acetyltransferase n=1 Tax=Brevundimonas sp. FT23028 TaxID=3393748 RepID=UPI003B588366
MTALRDLPDAHRFEQDFTDASGQTRTVFADYAVHDDVRVILHVEADPALRGGGAAGRFMQSLAAHARTEGLRLRPRCSYAVLWHRRHPEYDDLLA